MIRHTAVVQWSTGEVMRANCGTDRGRAELLVQQAAILRNASPESCEALGLAGKPSRVLVLTEQEPS